MTEAFEEAIRLYQYFRRNCRCGRLRAAWRTLYCLLPFVR